MTNDFARLGLRPEILQSISDLGFADPTPIQSEAIPVLLDGADLIGQAATGTGKTAAFALPIVNMIEPGRPSSPVALVLVPTRELAVQVCEAVSDFGRQQQIKAVPVYGGSPIYEQMKVLKKGVHIVVGTPGRTIDLMKRKALDLSEIATVVLDEADEMLDMGFAEDIEAILEATPASRQTVLFSATLPPRINAIAAAHQVDPVRVKVTSANEAASKALIRHTVYTVAPKHRAAALGRIIDMEDPTSALVFCRTRQDVDALTTTLNARGYRAEALHGGMDQDQRDRVMGRLRDGTASLLVATDVAARGLDVDTLTHVVNYDVPTQPESYVHRVGRVGRAGREGVAITLAEPRSKRRLDTIEQLIGHRLQRAEVPSVDDLQSRRVDLTVEAIRSELTEDLDDYNEVIHRLNDTADLREVALAAIKLVHDLRNPVADDTHIPAVAADRDKRGGDKRGRDKWGKDKWGKDKRNDRFDGRRDRGDSNGRFRDDDGRGRGPKGDRGQSRPRHQDDDTAFVYIGVGRDGKVRPGDLVGAIANETGLPGSDIGPIRISEHYSVVGVPPEALKRVVNAVNGSKIRGRRAKARPYV